MTTPAHTPLQEIKPYVTDKGGVVILNGPFSIDQARKVAALCEAAPDMLAVLKAAEKKIRDLSSQFLNGDVQQECIDARAAIAKAEAKP